MFNNKCTYAYALFQGGSQRGCYMPILAILGDSHTHQQSKLMLI